MRQNRNFKKLVRLSLPASHEHFQPYSASAVVNPFTEDVFAVDPEGSPEFAALYTDELNLLTRALGDLEDKPVASPCHGVPGRTALVMSALAGAGKSHLLHRWSRQLSARRIAHLHPLDFRDPDDLSWRCWLRQFFAPEFHHPAPETAGLDPGEDLSRRIARLFGEATLRSIQNRHIDQEEDAPIFAAWFESGGEDLFDPAEQEHPAVRWFHKAYPSLLPVLVRDYETALSLDEASVRPWLSFLYQYAHLSLKPFTLLERYKARAHYLHRSELLQCAHPDRARTGLTVVGRLLSSGAPIVIAIDEIDWIYRDENSARTLARQIIEFGKLVPRSLTVLSVNQDVWDDTFFTGLPQAMRDRLIRHSFRLPGVDRSQWRNFLKVRAGHLWESRHEQTMTALLDHLRELHAERSALTPRELLRAAADWWSQGQPSSAPARETIATPPSADPSSSPVREKDPVLENPATQRLVHAMGDLRSLIESRSHRPPSTPAPDTDLSSRSVSSTPPPPPARPVPTQSPPSERPPTIGPDLQAFITQFRQSSPPSSSPSVTVPPPATPSAESSPASKETQTVPTAPPSKEIQTPREVSQPVNGKSSTPNAPTPTQPSHEDTAARLRQIKIALSEKPALISQTLLRQVLETAGESFPALLQDHGNAAQGNPSTHELRWRFQQSEIHFGFRPYTESDYWRGLLQSTATRARELRQHDRTRVKLAVFGRRGEETLFEAWNKTSEDADHLEFCDMIILTDQQVMAVNAVGQLLEEQEETVQKQAVFSHASDDLDFFWKMITRPVWNLVSRPRRSSL